MKHYTHTHAGSSLYEYMELISNQLKSAIENNCIQIPPSTGNGFIKNCVIDAGFCFRYYHFNINNDVEFNWLSDAEKDSPVFKLIFFLEEPLPNQEFNTVKKETPAILYAADFNKTCTIKNNTAVDRMIFLFTKKWLQDNFNEAAEQIISKIDGLVKKNKPAFIAAEVDRCHYIFVHELAKEMKQKHFPLIHVKTKALALVNHFLNKIVVEDGYNINADQTLYYPEITKVECTLRACFDKPMPNISKLALEFNLSPSTLKRHFKIVYGKTIQTYYLTNKMAIGKSLIVAKSKTISEIAYTLGYTKVNSFSKAFKKQYGVLPKELISSYVNL